MTSDGMDAVVNPTGRKLCNSYFVLNLRLQHPPI